MLFASLSSKDDNPIQTCLWIAPSVADAAAINLNDIKTLLANVLSTWTIKGNPVYSNDLKCLTQNPHDCPILCHWVFDNFILVDEPFACCLLKSIATILKDCLKKF